MKIIKHIKDLIKIFIAIIISSIMKLNKKNRDIWIISERKDEAEDNGYHLYKYIKDNHCDQKIYYLIDKKSKSYLKIKKYKDVIQYNSLKHYIYYFLATKNISAFQFLGLPETPFIWIMEEKGIIKNKKIFLQHGIIKEMLPFLLYKNTKYDLFVCGGKPEWEYVKDSYDYPDGRVKYLGLCRFDNLHNITVKRRILLMPTWRHWFGMTNVTNEKEKKEVDNFIYSDYFQKYNSLINNERLQDILRKNNIEFIFYPHPEMQRFINEFQCNCNKIKIANRVDYNLQELLKESMCLITDYSSIAFDFAYMRKPLMYYQFDQNRYYEEHFKKGYFDCEKDGFGPVIKEESKLVDEIEQFITTQTNSPSYKKRAEEFFPLYDTRNCERNYIEIKNL